METPWVLAEAYQLLQQDLYLHLEQVEYLAEDDWTEETVQLIRFLLPELCSVIRNVLVSHRPDHSGQCQTCGGNWPCSVTILIHGLVKDRKYHFVRLLERKRP